MNKKTILKYFILLVLILFNGMVHLRNRNLKNFENGKIFVEYFFHDDDNDIMFYDIDRNKLLIWIS